MEFTVSIPLNKTARFAIASITATVLDKEYLAAHRHLLSRRNHLQFERPQFLSTLFIIVNKQYQSLYIARCLLACFTVDLTIKM